MTREQRIHLAIWKKALTMLPRELTITLNSAPMAISIRQGLYRSIKPYRSGELIDSQLQEASERLVVYLDKEKGNLVFREKQGLNVLEEMLDDLGITETELTTEEERTLKVDLEELLNAPKRETPFYTRGE